MFILNQIDSNIITSSSYKFPPDIENEFNNFKLTEQLFLESEKILSQDISMSQNIALLAHIIGMQLNLNKPTDIPYSPCLQIEDRRSFSIEDLTELHIEVIYEMTKITNNPLILSRIFDLLWIKKNGKEKFEHAKKSIDEYLNLIEKNPNKNSIYFKNYFKRAIQIWKKIGSPIEIQKKIIIPLIKSIDSYDSEPNDCMRLFIFEILPLCLDKNDFQTWLEKGNGFIQECKDQSNYDKARRYLSTMKDMWKKLKNNTKYKEMEIKNAELYEEEANYFEQLGAYAIILQDKFIAAIDAYKRVGNSKKKVTELLSKLNILQENIPKELKKMSTTIDLTPIIQNYIDQISKASYLEAINIIILLTSPQCKEKLILDAKEHFKSDSFLTIIQENLLNIKGQIVAKNNVNENEDVKFRYFAIKNYLLHLSIQGKIINYCRQEVANRVDRDNDFFDKILSNTPFVPEGHFHQFKRGILLGLEGDWISCSHILLPQIENSLRYIMQNYGYNVLKSNENGIQEEKNLNELIYDPDIKAILGEDLQFQLQILLTEKSGLNLRNRVAHGLIHDSFLLIENQYVAFLWAHTIYLSIFFQTHHPLKR